MRETEIHEAVPFVVHAGFRRVHIEQNLHAWPAVRSSVELVEVLPDVLAQRLRYAAADDGPAAFRLTETSLAEGDRVFVTLRVYELDPPRYDVVRISPERGAEATWPFYAHPAAVLGVFSFVCVCWLIANLLSRVSGVF